MSYYPVALLYSWIPHSWNAFVISAYVMASCFTYGYIYRLTTSRLAALVGGTTYGLSGFFMAHLGHTSMIHAAAWIPLMIWTFEELRRRISAGWFSVAALAVANCALGGHPQIFLFSTTLSFCYLVCASRRAPSGTVPFWLAGLSSLVLGAGLAAVTLLPMVELTALSQRAQWPLEQFLSYPLYLRELPRFLFPYLYGGFWNPISNTLTPFFGATGLAETTGYVGLLPLLLAGVGFALTGDRFQGRFWTAVAIFALLMACSKEIPLARFLYHLYGYNRTRVQPRHLVEFSLAVSVLAGLGIKALADTSALKRLQAVRRATTTAAVGLLLALLAFIYSGGNLNKQLAHLNVSNVPLLPWRNPAISIPLLVMLAGSLVLYYWSRRHTKFSAALLVLVLSLDLGSFGWLCEWRYRVSKPEDLQVPDVLTSYKQRLVNSGQRLLSMTPSFGPAETAPANLSRLWGIPNARGYNPLILSRYSELLDQSVPAYQVFSDNNRSLDILSVVYVLVPKPFLGDGNNSAADHVNRDGDVPRYLQNPRRWHHVDDFLHTAVSENGHAMPRAWLVPKTIPLQPHQILRAIQESTLPDGRAYDPSQVALVEEPFVFDVENPDSHAAAKVAQLSDTRIEVHTECGTPAFLVLSDVYYPGWRATINGEPAHIFQTNYVLRGVKVPAGYNVVCFEFRPLSFYSGVAVSSCSLLLTMAILAGIIHEHSPQRRRERRGNAENRAEA